jgi:aspartyl-tRNA(Asn)/glutamyl-tRNA(Gln) amidotransferase subunit A
MLADVHAMSIAELSALLETRVLSPVELTEAFLRRIEAVDPSINSFTTVTGDRAMEDARAAEVEIAAGRRRGPMHGMPVAVKDNIDTARIETTASSRILEGRVPTKDAAVVQALSQAGAVLLGKLNMSEFAIGLSYLDDPAPPARNPWDRARIAGSSSSGSAAAVAAGLCSASLGTDTGGSIRLPAAYTGVVGLKPTYEVLSREGTIPLAWSLDHVGPLTRTAADAATVFGVCATQGSGRDSSFAARGAIRPIGSLDRYHIGVPEEWIAMANCQPDVSAAFQSALDVMKGLGAHIESVSLPGAEDALRLVTTIMASEALAYHEPWLRSDRERYGAQCRTSLLAGLAYSAVDYLQAQRARQLLLGGMEIVMRSIDVIATPTLPWVAPTQAEHEAQRGHYPSQPFLGLFNLTGQPSVSVPCGFDRAPMPIGLLLSGRPFEDATVLQVAAEYEAFTPWHRRRPRDI